MRPLNRSDTESPLFRWRVFNARTHATAAQAPVPRFPPQNGAGPFWAAQGTRRSFLWSCCFLKSLSRWRSASSSAEFGKFVVTWSRSAPAFLQRRPSPAFRVFTKEGAADRGEYRLSDRSIIRRKRLAQRLRCQCRADVT